MGLRDQRIEFDVTAAEAREASRTQRGRFVQMVRGLSDEQLRGPSRCSEWSVQDVARHVTQMSDLMQRAIVAARNGEKFAPFKEFNPKVTPNELVRAIDGESAETTIAEFDRTTRSLEHALDELGDDASLLLASPAGRQPWPRSILHALFDSAVHERDVAEPVGVRVDAGEAETGAIAAYQVLLASRIACAFGMSYAAELVLTGVPVLTVRVDGADVSVTRTSGTGAPVCRGNAVPVLDAMTNRGDLGSVLSAPPEVTTALSTLSTLV